MVGEAYLDYGGMQYLVEKIIAEIERSIPAGVVLAWHGSENNIPSGWALCNGQNGTPDLRDRFVLGASSSHVVGEKGGSDSHIITVEEMPAHTHSESGVTQTESDVGGSLFSGGENILTPSSDIETGSAGEGNPMSIMPPYYALLYIMKMGT